MTDVRACRCCLSTDVKLEPLKDVCERIYKTITGLELDQSDGYPYFVCSECKSQIKKVLAFRRKCRRAYYILKEIKIVKNKVTLDDILTVNRKKATLESAQSLWKLKNCGFFTLKTNESEETEHYEVTNKQWSNDIYKTEVLKHSSGTNLKTDSVLEEFVPTVVTDHTFIFDNVMVEKNEECDEKNEQIEEPVYMENDDIGADVDHVEEESDNVQQEVEFSENPEPEVDMNDVFKDLKEKSESSQSESEIEEEIETAEKDKNPEQEDESKITEVYSAPCARILAQSHIERLTFDQQVEMFKRRQKCKKNKNGLFKCPTCLLSFINNKKLEEHMAKHDLNLPHACNVCELRFKNEHVLQRHMETMHTYKYTCKVCDMAFYTLQDRLIHRNAGHYFNCKPYNKYEYEPTNGQDVNEFEVANEVNNKEEINVKNQGENKIQNEVVTKDRSNKNEVEIGVLKRDGSNKNIFDIEVVKKDVSNKNEVEIEALKRYGSNKNKVEIEVLKKGASNKNEVEIGVLKRDGSNKNIFDIEVVKKDGSNQNEVDIGGVKKDLSNINEVVTEVDEKDASNENKGANFIYENKMEGTKIDEKVPIKAKKIVRKIRVPMPTVTLNRLLVEHFLRVHRMLNLSVEGIWKDIGNCFICNICHFICRKKNSLREHIEKHSVSYYKCKICELNFGKIPDAVMHLFKHEVTASTIHSLFCKAGIDNKIVKSIKIDNKTDTDNKTIHTEKLVNKTAGNIVHNKTDTDNKIIYRENLVSESAGNIVHNKTDTDNKIIYRENLVSKTPGNIVHNKTDTDNKIIYRENLVSKTPGNIIDKKTDTDNKTIHTEKLVNKTAGNIVHNKTDTDNKIIYRENLVSKSAGNIVHNKTDTDNKIIYRENLVSKSAGNIVHNKTDTDNKIIYRENLVSKTPGNIIDKKTDTDNKILHSEKLVSKMAGNIVHNKTTKFHSVLESDNTASCKIDTENSKILEILPSTITIDTDNIVNDTTIDTDNNIVNDTDNKTDDSVTKTDETVFSKMMNADNKLETTLRNNTLDILDVLRTDEKFVSDENDTTDICHRKSCQTRVRGTICNICGLDCKCTAKLLKHRRVVHPREWLIAHCGHCGESYMTDYHMYHHQFKKHGWFYLPENAPYSCDECAVPFSNETAYKTHLARLGHTESPDYERACAKCRAYYQTEEQFALHLELCGVPKKKCPYCKEIVKQKDARAHYEAKHKDENRICPVCGDLVQHTIMQFHIKRHKENITLYTCKFCNVKFQLPDRYCHHLIVRHTAKPYQCGVCGQFFTYRYSVRDHILKIHAPELTYDCTHCSRKFAHESYLAAHVKKAHGEAVNSSRDGGKKAYSNGILTVYPHVRIDLSLVEPEYLDKMKLYLCDYKNENLELVQDYRDYMVTAEDLEKKLHNTTELATETRQIRKQWGKKRKREQSRANIEENGETTTKKLKKDTQSEVVAAVSSLMKYDDGSSNDYNESVQNENEYDYHLNDNSNNQEIFYDNLSNDVGDHNDTFNNDVKKGYSVENYNNIKITYRYVKTEDVLSNHFGNITFETDNPTGLGSEVSVETENDDVSYSKVHNTINYAPVYKNNVSDPSKSKKRSYTDTLKTKKPIIKTNVKEIASPKVVTKPTIGHKVKTSSTVENTSNSYSSTRNNEVLNSSRITNSKNTTFPKKNSNTISQNTIETDNFKQTSSNNIETGLTVNDNPKPNFDRLIANYEEQMKNEKTSNASVGQENIYQKLMFDEDFCNTKFYDENNMGVSNIEEVNTEETVPEGRSEFDCVFDGTSIMIGGNNYDVIVEDGEKYDLINNQLFRLETA